MTTLDRIQALEAERDAAAARLRALAREPSPWIVEGFEYQQWQHASKVRGALTGMLLRRLDALNNEISLLTFGEPLCAA